MHAALAGLDASTVLLDVLLAGRVEVVVHAPVVGGEACDLEHGVAARGGGDVGALGLQAADDPPLARLDPLAEGADLLRASPRHAVHEPHVRRHLHRELAEGVAAPPAKIVLLPVSDEALHARVVLCRGVDAVSGELLIASPLQDGVQLEVLGGHHEALHEHDGALLRYEVALELLAVEAAREHEGLRRRDVAAELLDLSRAAPLERAVVHRVEAAALPHHGHVLSAVGGRDVIHLVPHALDEVGAAEVGLQPGLGDQLGEIGA
mmetsp:Transcript_34475/g.81726  ORF Transcript_34475/g.81726 Transcript_34475/m.81726 type:complete len:264 (-) Transcript_34475:300-1091(-)